jgi:chromosome segregation ATPase
MNAHLKHGEIMPTDKEMQELHEADKRLAAAIEEMQRQRAHDSERLDRAEENISRLNEFMTELRESIATKDDIAGLRGDLRDRLDRDEFLNEKLEHYAGRVAELEEQRAERVASKETRFNRRMSWAMVALFVGELIIGWLGLRHG